MLAAQLKWHQVDRQQVDGLRWLLRAGTVSPRLLQAQDARRDLGAALSGFTAEVCSGGPQAHAARVDANGLLSAGDIAPAESSPYPSTLDLSGDRR